MLGKRKSPKVIYHHPLYSPPFEELPHCSIFWKHKTMHINKWYWIRITVKYVGLTVLCCVGIAAIITAAAIIYDL